MKNENIFTWQLFSELADQQRSNGALDVLAVWKTLDEYDIQGEKRLRTYHSIRELYMISKTIHSKRKENQQSNQQLSSYGELVKGTGIPTRGNAQR